VSAPVVLALAPAFVVLLGVAPPAAWASSGHGHGGGSGSGSGTPTGNDVSYPQCGSSLPVGEAFGIVGLNGGLANDLNACFGPSSSYPSYAQSELYWAAASASGTTAQPKASLYVNTADPGDMYNGQPVGDWPTSGGNATYGACTTTTVASGGSLYTVGQDSPACAWQYGEDRAAQDASWLTEEAAAVDGQHPAVSVSDQAGAYPWWLDVETANSWQSGASGQQMNVADLQGMVAGLEAAGVTRIGVYSTSSQWETVTGGTTSAASGSLFGLPDWIPGARTVSGAESNCSLAAFTGGQVLVTQWTSHGVDGDYSCRAW
jgi:hypothetical protein